MQNEKKSEIRRSLEHFQQHLSDMKEKNPEGDYSDVEKMITALTMLLEKMDSKNFMIIAFLKRVLFLFLQLIIYIVSICIVLGFSFSLLSFTDYMRLCYLIPIGGLVLLLVHRLLDAVLNTIDSKRPFFDVLFSNILMIVIFAFLDNLFFHMFKNVGSAIIVITSVLICASIGEFYLYRKWILF